MKLKDWVRDHKMSVPVMAQALGISSNYLYRISSGAISPSYPLSKLIEGYTDGQVTVEDLRLDDKIRCPACGQMVKDTTYLADMLKK